MTEDRDAEVIQLPRPEDIPLDLPQEFDDSVLAYVLRWLRDGDDQPDGAVARFNNFI